MPTKQPSCPHCGAATNNNCGKYLVRCTDTECGRYSAR